VNSLFAASPLIAILIGGLGGGAVLLLILALRGLPPAQPGSRSGALERTVRDLMGPRGALALIAGVVVLIATGWIVGGIAAALLVLGWRSLSGAASERKAIARLEALATWTESLRDTIAGAVGLEQAIPATYMAAPPVIRRPLAMLIDRLRTRDPLPEALMKFADDLGDPSADLIIAALILNARLRGPGLRDVLGSLSTSAREELEMRQRIDAARKATRRSVQIIVVITLVVVLGMTVLNRSYVEPFDHPAGQVVLVAIFGLFGAGFFWLRKLAQFEVPARFLTGRSKEVLAIADLALPAGTEVSA
jgi:Flp pilus assembly protein TadB